jgi:EF-P beta-lysylation protein EpmB
MSNVSSCVTVPPAEVATPASADWQSALADAITRPAELCQGLGLPASVASGSEGADRAFSLLVPRGFVVRMRSGDPDDPLLLQVLPRQEELREHWGFTADPLGEANGCWTPGVLWKYPSRVLIVASGVCAVHCRFCFRRHFPYHTVEQQEGWWEQALQKIASEPSVREVILSGGDPLALEDHLLADFARRLAQIAHVRRLRIHTRLPIVIPQRVTDELCRWLRGTRLTTYIAVHANHPRELDSSVEAAIGRLVEAGVPVLSQSVLLKGVNDRVEVLAELCERLIDFRVIPYYLHQLDPVAGAAHFQVSDDAGRHLISQLRARLPGYAVPRYVREVPGGLGKVVLG